MRLCDLLLTQHSKLDYVLCSSVFPLQLFEGMKYKDCYSLHSFSKQEKTAKLLSMWLKKWSITKGIEEQSNDQLVMTGWGLAKVTWKQTGHTATWPFMDADIRNRERNSNKGKYSLNKFLTNFYSSYNVRHN